MFGHIRQNNSSGPWRRAIWRRRSINAARRIGDDTLQRESSGRVRPDSFTHGTAAQRQRWFLTGFRSGTMTSCDTFSARQL
ncbi:neutral zinc metallopeptidase [Synechococcus sp. CBW1107]|uniref:neutral zinc metallopeptidase n=1 Tax=Synechococcus sp. CBW1107 TaxID=2789857 RepID=UPI001E61FC2B|nr:neutral zinc metallopeptidase [Synechococcus sp. CBW1107]